MPARGLQEEENIRVLERRVGRQAVELERLRAALASPTFHGDVRAVTGRAARGAVPAVPDASAIAMHGLAHREVVVR